MMDSNEGEREKSGVKKKSLLKNVLDKEKEKRKAKYENRDYQIYLYQAALKQNLIVCLPTGSGKSFVAVQVIKHYLPRAIQEKKNIFFLAPTIPLVHQQADYIRSHLIKNIGDKSMVGVITGDSIPDNWDKKNWDDVLARVKIIVMTDAILKKALENCTVRFEQMSLLVIDECHNAVGNHSMAHIMSYYSKEAVADTTRINSTLPRILGLTATIIKANSNRMLIFDDVMRIQHLFHAKAITYSNYTEVLKCSTSAKVEIIQCKQQIMLNETEALKKHIDRICLDIISLEFSAVLDTRKDLVKYINHPTLKSPQQIMKEPSKAQKDCKSLLQDLVDILVNAGPYCFQLAVISSKTTVINLKRKQKFRNGPSNESCEMRLFTYVDHQLTVLLDAVQRLIYSRMDCLNPVLDFVSPKITELLKLLRDAGVSHEGGIIPFCGLVFCQTRLMAKILAHYLQDLASGKSAIDEYSFIRADFVVGCSTYSVKSSRASLATQKNTLQNFRDRKLNLLVATKVLEEGLNVPDCNFVVRFNKVDSYPSFIQSMGRARQQNAKFYVLCNEEEFDAQKEKINGFQEYGRSLGECLQLNALQAESALTFRYEETEIDKLVPPFFTGNGTQRITAHSAPSIVYSYCQTLSTDKLSILTPIAWWVADEIRRLYSLYIYFPPNSLVQNVHGDLFANQEVAKMSAFLQACRELWEKGAIDPDNLLPYPRSHNPYTSDFLEIREKADPEVATGEKKIGSKNRFQWIEKKVPQILKESHVQPGTALNLYAIEIKVDRSVFLGKPQYSQIYDFTKAENLVGLVTPLNLEEVNQHILFSRDGNFTITLKQLASDVVLSPQDFDSWMEFQEFVFGDLLQITNPIFERNLVSPWLFVALRKTDLNDTCSAEINTSIIPEVLETRNIDFKAEVTEEERSGLSVNPAAYEDKIIVPWYITDYNDKRMYCVLRIRNDMSPKSIMATDKVSGKPISFNGHFTAKGLVITNKNQPLLEVKALASQLNFLKIKYNNVTVPKEVRKEEAHNSLILHHLPELVTVHPCPQSLMVQIKFLPSVIHRLTRLLAAKELHEAINSHCGNLWQPRDLALENAKYLNQFSKSIIELAKQSGVIPIELTTSTVPCVANEVVEECSGVVLHSPSVLITHGDPETSSQTMSSSDLEHVHPSDLLWSHHKRASLDESEDVTHKSINFGSVENLINLYPASPRQCLIKKDDAPKYDFNRRCDFNQERGPLLFEIMEATTLSNANDSISLEKMELIGDSVLKFIVSSHIISHFPEWDEGKMTCLRNRLISNRHLCGLGSDRDLGSLLAGSIFKEECLLHPGVTIIERYRKPVVELKTTYSVYQAIAKENPEIKFEALSDDDLNNLIAKVIDEYSHKAPSKKSLSFGPANHTHTHARIGDKSIADCVESLIGVYYLNGGISSALQFMDWVGLKGPTLDPKVSRPYQHFQSNPWILPEYPDLTSVDAYLPGLQALQDQIDYKFQQPWLLVEAMTHPSYFQFQSFNTGSYERLEFIGDAVLDFLITHHIYTTKLAETPGNLTDLRSALVNNVTFGSLAVKFGLHTHLLQFSAPLAESILAFETHQKNNNHKILSQFKERLLSDLDCLVAEDIEVPKVLGDLWESVAGAIYLDSNYDLDAVWTVFYRLMKEEIDTFSKDIPKSPVREIMEKFPMNATFTSVEMDYENDERKNNGREMKIVQLNIPMYQPFYGCGTRKSNAKIAAAKFALKTINAKTSGEMEKAKSRLNE